MILSPRKKFLKICIFSRTLTSARRSWDNVRVLVTVLLQTFHYFYLSIFKALKHFQKSPESDNGSVHPKQKKTNIYENNNSQKVRAVHPHSFLADSDPDPGGKINADPDPA